MITLLLLLSSEAQAVPLDLCANRGTGPILGLGGQYLWEVDGNPDLLEPLWWSTLCGVGGNAAPAPTILQPTEGMVFTPGGPAEIAVSADAGDPERGWGRCEWRAEKDGEIHPLPVRLPGASTSRTSLPFSRVNPHCSGAALIGALPAGTYLLFVKASDLYGAYGEDATEVRVNRVPDLLLTEPVEHSVYVTGESFTATVLVGDDTPVEAGAVVTFVVTGPDGSTTTPCVLDTPGTCTTTLTAPGVAGGFVIRASYTDVDGTTGEVSTPSFYANDVPGVVITSPTDGDMIETDEPTELVVQVTDATALPGDPVTVSVDESTGTWTSVCELGPDLSCAVEYTPAANGEYTMSASYTDAYGERGVSPDVAVLANDTPTLTVSGLTDGMLLEPGETPIDLVLTVTDHDVSSGSLTGSVTSASGAATLTLGSLDASGVASATLVLPERDVYTASFTFTDAYGVAVTTDPIVVTTDQAPTVGLLTPSSGETVTIPSDDPSFEAYTYSFEVADADGDALTVQPAVGFDDRVACSDSEGRWDCDLDTTGWTAGVYTVAVLVSDGLLEATDSFDIDVVGADDYDYDGDGVLEREWLEYGNGYGDCAPDDPTTYGASPDAGLAAAPELCDTVDNDCDGVVNDGLPDPEGGNTIGEATSITGTTVTLSSGDSIEDEGSLYSDGDVDWWYFEVDSDYLVLGNASFSITMSVPSTSDGAVAGAWVSTVRRATTRGGVTEIRPTIPTDTDCSSLPGTCFLTWTVSGSDTVDGEYYWWIGVSSASWEAAMCSESSEAPTYALQVSRE